MSNGKTDKRYWVQYKSEEGRVWPAVCRKPGVWTVVAEDGSALFELSMDNYVECDEPDDDDDDDDNDETEAAIEPIDEEEETAWSRFRQWWRSRWV